MNGEAEHSVAGGEAAQVTTDALPAATNGEPFFQRPDALSFSLTTAVALAVYCVTLAPEVTLEFSGMGGDDF